MKKLIYEVFYKDRSYMPRDTTPVPEVRIYDDQSFELYEGCIEVSPSRDVTYHFPENFEVTESEKEGVMAHVKFIFYRFDALWPIHYGNSRYPGAFELLRATCGEIPFEKFRIVYHGEGKPWERVYPDDTVF